MAFNLDDYEPVASRLDRWLKANTGTRVITDLVHYHENIAVFKCELWLDDRLIDRQQAILSSMTKGERKKPDILAASRKRRIAKGAGVDVSEVNRLLKQHRQMADAFKAMSKDGGKGFARMAGMMGGGGGDPTRELLANHTLLPGLLVVGLVAFSAGII